MILFGHFYRALSSKREAGQIEFVDGKARVSADDDAICDDVEIESIQGKKDIYLKNGFLFSLESELLPEQQKQIQSALEMKISLLENFSVKKSIVLFLMLISLLFLLRMMLTWATPYAVEAFPHDWEKSLGENTYETLNDSFLKPSRLPEERVAHLRKRATELAVANDIEPVDLYFHRSSFFGANALALPGGPVIVTDDLVDLLEQNDLILAVIAHEYAHIEKRHHLHQFIELIGFTALASLLFGANESFLEEASAVMINLWGNKVSQDLEKEADLVGVGFLANTDIDKKSMYEAIKILTNQFCSKLEDGQETCADEAEGSSWLSTHPSGVKRLNYLSQQ